MNSRSSAVPLYRNHNWEDEYQLQKSMLFLANTQEKSIHSPTNIHLILKKIREIQTGFSNAACRHLDSMIGRVNHYSKENKLMKSQTQKITINFTSTCFQFSMHL